MEQVDKREHILEVAEKLFAQNGFNGTSVRDIAKEAEVNIAMISYYFGSKEKLLIAVFNKSAADIRFRLEEILHDDKLDSLDKVYKLIDTYIDRIIKKQHFHKIMVREQVTDKDNLISDLIRETKQKNQKLVAALIHNGQKKGDFKKSVDIPLLMTTLFGTTNQLITTQHYYKEINNLQDMSNEEFEKYIRKKLSAHLKKIFKAILTDEN